MRAGLLLALALGAAFVWTNLGDLQVNFQIDGQVPEYLAWANRGSFLCRQQLTAYAYGPWLAEQILERTHWYLDEPLEQVPSDAYLITRLCEGYRHRTAADFAVLRDRYGVGLAIVERNRVLAFEKVAQNDEFVVYDLEHPL